MSYADQLDRIAEELTREGNPKLARDARNLAQHVRLTAQQVPFNAESSEANLDALEERARVTDPGDAPQWTSDKVAEVAGLTPEQEQRYYEGLAARHPHLDQVASLAGVNHTAADLDQPALLRAQRLKKPSAQHKSDLYVCRIFRRSGGDCQIYEDVKHLWWTADSSVLVIVQYTNPECTQWRNISWLREVIDWYTLTHQEFE